MRRRILCLNLLVVVWGLFAADKLLAAEENFYQGKTLRFVVGFSPGGGFDAFTRLIGRHIAKHIPGNPTVVVENMTGAGSLVAANYIYNKAKPDGLTVGTFNGGLVVQQILGRKGVEFDARKSEWLGVPVQASSVCALRKGSGIGSLEQWFAAKEPVKLGGSAPGAVSTDDMPRILKAALNFPLVVVDGYKGTADIRLAVESGEVAGVCNTWESFKATWPREIQSGAIKMLLQMLPKKHPELTEVPNAIDYAKSEEGRKMIRVAYDMNAILWLYALPPAMPKDRLQQLRRAFMNTLRDPAYLAEAKKANVDTDPLGGEEVEKIVGRFFALESDFVQRLKTILIPSG